MSSEAVFGNQGNERAEQVERPADAPADPAHVETGHVATPPAQETAPPAGQAPEPEKPISDRERIAKRVQDRRREHDKQFRPEHVPPFVEAQQRQDETPQPAEPAAAAQEPQQAQPAPAEPKGYTLKVRGREVSVPNRDELLRIAEVEPHEANDYTDAQLIKIAQRMQAGLAYIEEGRGFRDQARVAVPVPAAPQAGVPQQQQPPAQAEGAPSIDDLRKTYVEKLQVGTVEEAAEAHRALEEAVDAERRQRQDAQSAEVNARQGVTNDLRSFGEKNQDIVGNPTANDLLLMTVTREMGDDLRGLGLTEQQISSALTNPREMTDAILFARNKGFPVRTNAQFLDAAGKKVRDALKMPAPQAAPAPASAASQARIDEKRALPAQPVRSGNPPSVTPPPVDMTSKRKNVIAGMQRSRTAPNIKEMVG